MGEQLFAGIALCSTGLELDINEQVRKIVVACGGTFEDNLALDGASHTTNLIAETVGSHKHRAAVAHGVCVASPRWVFESFHAQRLLDVELYALRVLEGLVVCTAGLPQDQRGSVAHLAQTHGALYDGNLTVGFTSVLIAQHAEGAKYEAAIAHRIPVVHVAWLHACIEDGVLADEADFALQREEQVASCQLTQIAQSLQLEAQELVAGLPELVREARYKAQASLESGACAAEWLELFDGCVLLLLGFSPEMETLIQRIIRTGMGTIYYDMAVHQVTHVVVSASLTDLQALKSLQSQVVAADAQGEVYFVSARWVLDSMKCQRLEPEELYPIEIDSNQPVTGGQNASFTLVDTAAEASFSQDVEVAASQQTEAEDATSESGTLLPEELSQSGNLGDVPSETLHAMEPRAQPKPVFPGCAFLLLCRDPEDRHVVQPMLKKLRSERGGAEAFALVASDFGHADAVQMAFITYAVVCSGAVLDEREALETQRRFHEAQRLEDDSSESRNAEREADDDGHGLAKRPRLEKSRGSPRRLLRFVSDLWVTCSLAAGARLPSSAHELFQVTVQQPRALFPWVLPLRDFRRVRASVSVYVHLDRDVVCELLRLAGGRVSKKLSRRCTHLVCAKPLGTKYEMAKRWGLHVVTASWLVQSLRRGEHLDESSVEFQVGPETAIAPSQEDVRPPSSSPPSSVRSGLL